jgi:hypothetical protein
MRGKKTRYTFVIEFLGGTYVRQNVGESPELALRAWLRCAGEEDFEWATHRVELLRAVIDQIAVPIDECKNVWCMSGVAGEHLFLIHIIGTDSGSGESKSVACEQVEQIASDSKRWGWGDWR